ncbi:MAG: caspase family protein [Rhizobiaceae bacterium]
MLRVIGAILLALVWLLPTQGLAEKRLALVIGNDDYQNILKLQKATNDAEAMGNTLEALGFDVTRALNADRAEMNRVFEDFARKIREGDTAMLFYAGHGVEINGENYLLPVDMPDADSGTAGNIESQAMALDSVLARLRSRAAQLNLVVLDACRNNPFSGTGPATRSLGGRAGLARISAPQGTFVMYSADVGEAALDRLSEEDKNPNSVFTRTLIPLMKTPGMDLVDTAREVRRKVRKLARSISHNQTPAYYDAVLGDFFFTREGGNPVVADSGQNKGDEKEVASVNPDASGDSARPETKPGPITRTPIGKAMVVTGGERDSIRLWDAGKAQLIAELEGEKIDISTVKITSGGRTLAVATRDGALFSYRIPEFKKQNAMYPGFMVTSIGEAKDGTLVIGGENGAMAAIDPITFDTRWENQSHDAVISPVVVQSDQKTVLTASGDGTIAVSDIANGEVLGRISTVNNKPITDFEIIAASTVVASHEDGTIAYLNTRTGEVLSSFKGNRGWISSVGITPDGSKVVTAGVDGSLSVWVLGTDQLVQKLDAHSDVAAGAKFMKVNKQKIMISTSFDGKLKFWNKDNTQPLIALDHGSAILSFDYLDGS